jgi:twitching motility two-component system response regulator PilH
MAKEILIADSDKADQEEFQKIFETTDYHLIFSESGEDALFRAKLFKPDMIIASGTGLQEMGGSEFCEAIKGDPEFKHVPFILISSILDEISEKDRRRVQADGVISKPLKEDEILNLVDHLMEEEAIGKREGMVSEKQEEFLLNEIGEGEEEIIELVDVVEEPEPRMSIDNFVTSEKEEPFGEITPLESWDKLEFEEKPEEKELVHHPEREKEVIGEMNLQLKREMPLKEASPEEELFEKIELEEILEKVEQLRPSLEKEWPSEKEVRDIEERSFKMEEPAEKFLDLSEFETALQKEVKAALPEEELQPFFIEEPKKKVSEEAIPVVEFVEEEELKELPEEEFPDELLEEILGEEEISVIEEPKELKPEEVRPKEVRAEEIKADRLEEVEAPKISLEEIPPLVRAVDKQMQEVISQKIQEMMKEIVTKLVPEMTQNVVGLTIERIEKMVREVVPDLAEKAIQEEIKRLQKGEKE